MLGTVWQNELASPLDPRFRTHGGALPFLTGVQGPWWDGMEVCPDGWIGRGWLHQAPFTSALPPPQGVPGGLPYSLPGSHPTYKGSHGGEEFHPNEAVDNPLTLPGSSAWVPKTGRRAGSRSDSSFAWEREVK